MDDVYLTEDETSLVSTLAADATNIATAALSITAVEGRATTLETDLGTAQDDIDAVEGRATTLEGEMNAAEAALITHKASDDHVSQYAQVGHEHVTLPSGCGTLGTTAPNALGDGVSGCLAVSQSAGTPTSWVGILDEGQYTLVNMAMSAGTGKSTQIFLPYDSTTIPVAWRTASSSTTWHPLKKIADSEHDHDFDYAMIHHFHCVDDITDLPAYALTTHTHAGIYAGILHSHSVDDILDLDLSGYALTTHDHVGVYATTSHSHGSIDAGMTNLVNGYTVPNALDTGLSVCVVTSATGPPATSWVGIIPTGTYMLLNMVLGGGDGHTAQIFMPYGATTPMTFRVAATATTWEPIVELSEVGHTHATLYSALAHTHATLYAALSHTHTEDDITDLGSYSLTSHNHSGTYSLTSHTHTSLDLSSGLSVDNITDSGTNGVTIETAAIFKGAITDIARLAVTNRTAFVTPSQAMLQILCDQNSADRSYVPVPRSGYYTMLEMKCESSGTSQRWSFNLAATAEYLRIYEGTNGGNPALAGYWRTSGFVDAFTGSHYNLMDETLTAEIGEGLHIGRIVVSTGVINNTIEPRHDPTIDECLPVVVIATTHADKTVFGVISHLEDEFLEGKRNGTRHGNMCSLQVVLPGDRRRVIINSVGEGAIAVSDERGPIANGDLITSGGVDGRGVLQDDDLFHSYTVAKAVMDASFDDDGFAFIACTYHCG